MKKLILFFTLMATGIAAKNIIWDLGLVLIDFSTFGMARSIGLSRFAWYILLDRKNPAHIRAKAFSILRMLKNDSKQDPFCTKTYPDIFKDLFSNAITSSQLIEQCKKQIVELTNTDKEKAGHEKNFSSNREKELVENALIAMFDPNILAQNAYIIEPIYQLLLDCAQAVDGEGKPKHQLFIISNYAEDAFDQLIKQGSCKAIFDLIPEKNRIISGKIGMAKPDAAIFQHLLDTHNLKAEDCFLIDDLSENIAGAECVGITGIHLPRPDAQYLKACLNRLEIL